MPTRRHLIHLLLLGALAAFLGGIWWDEPLVQARTGGGQNYRAPRRSSTPSSRRSRPAPSRSSNHDQRRNYSSPAPIPVPVPIGPGAPYHASSGTHSGSSCVGPFFGLFLIILIIVAIHLMRRKKNSGRASIKVDTVAQGKGIGALRERDPQFNPVAFIERVKQTAEKINEAWLAGDMNSVRRLLSDGVFIRLQTQLTLLNVQGLKNIVTEQSVVSSTILAAQADDRWDTIHMKIVGQGRDRDVPYQMSNEEARRQAMAVELRQYEEVWSFKRRRGRETKPGINALESRCPNCGADLPLSDLVKCEYCSALINSGANDWILAEITQPEEWNIDAAGGEIEGLAELRQRDELISRQEIEDRASVIFWKWVEARATNNANKLNRFVSSQLPKEQWNDNLQIDAANLQKVAVGSAELIQTIAATDETSWDRAKVEIRWSAATDGGEIAPAVHVLHLLRAASARSERGLSSLDCPNCGGSLARSDEPFCQYCGEALGSGQKDWVLEQITSGEHQF